MDLGSVLALLRNTKGLNQRAFAKELGVSNGAVAMWETNKRQPDLETLKKIAAFFNVSTDYLLGNTENPKEEPTVIPKKDSDHGFFFFFFDHQEEYLEKLRSEMLEQNITDTDFKECVGISVNSSPTIEHLIKISNLLHISIDYMLGLSDIKSISTIDTILTSKEKNILTTFRNLNEDNQDILIGEAKKALKEQRYEESVAADEPIRKVSGK